MGTKKNTYGQDKRKIWDNLHEIVHLLYINTSIYPFINITHYIMNITMKAMQSSCCGGGFKAVCTPDFLGDKKPNKGSTWSYECAVCKKACDIEPADGGKKIIMTLTARKHGLRGLLRTILSAIWQR